MLIHVITSRSVHSSMLHRTSLSHNYSIHLLNLIWREEMFIFKAPPLLQRHAMSEVLANDVDPLSVNTLHTLSTKSFGLLLNSHQVEYP